MTRAEAIKILTEIWSLPEKQAEAVDTAIEALKQPERKKGNWIVTGMFNDFLKCSCCGYKKPWNEDTFNFCPNCGAEMEGEE